MLSSLLHTNSERQIDLYLLHSSLTEKDLEQIRLVLTDSQCTLRSIRADRSLLKDAPITDRYPQEMYYRIFAAKYLPSHLSRVLYLDPDLVINGPLDHLYQTPLDGCLFAAASHLGRFFSAIKMCIRDRIRLVQRADHRLSLSDTLGAQCLQHLHFIKNVQMAGGLIQQQHRSALTKSAGD